MECCVLNVGRTTVLGYYLNCSIVCKFIALNSLWILYSLWLYLLLVSLLSKGALHHNLSSCIIRQELGLCWNVLDSASETHDYGTDWLLGHGKLLARSTCLTAIIFALCCRRGLVGYGIPHNSSATSAITYSSRRINIVARWVFPGEKLFLLCPHPDQLTLRRGTFTLSQSIWSYLLIHMVHRFELVFPLWIFSNLHLITLLFTQLLLHENVLLLHQKNLLILQTLPNLIVL